MIQSISAMQPMYPCCGIATVCCVKCTSASPGTCENDVVRSGLGRFQSKKYSIQVNKHHELSKSEFTGWFWVWGPFEAQLRPIWGSFEAHLRWLLAVALYLYTNLILSWFWGSLRVSLKMTENNKKSHRGQFE